MNLFNNSLTSLDHTLLDNCVNTGEIIGSVNSAGGILGWLYIEPKDDIDVNAVKITVQNCRNEGNVSSIGNYIGGIIANVAIVKGTTIVKGCTNTGVIKKGETIADIRMGDASNGNIGLLVGGNMYYQYGSIISFID